MPSGVYDRSKLSEEQQRTIRENLAKGHGKRARAKATAALKKNAQDPEWRKMVSQVTSNAMRRPDIRKKHLKGLARAFGYNYDHFVPIPLSTKQLAFIGKEYVDRFWTRVKIGGKNECWPFQGKRCKKLGEYGFFFTGKEEVAAHRLVLMMKLGRPLVNDEQSLHTCDNPPCCNPSHLFLGNNKMNVEDKMKKGRWRVANRGSKK